MFWDTLCKISFGSRVLMEWHIMLHVCSFVSKCWDLTVNSYTCKMNIETAISGHQFATPTLLSHQKDYIQIKYIKRPLLVLQFRLTFYDVLGTRRLENILSDVYLRSIDDVLKVTPQATYVTHVICHRTHQSRKHPDIKKSTFLEARCDAHLRNNLDLHWKVWQFLLSSPRYNPLNW